jgi:predicted nucleic acid-binding protein
MQTGRGEGVQLFTSPPLLAELTDILSRAKFAKKITASLLSVDQLVDLYAEFAYVVESRPVPRIAPDPDDDVVIGTALAAKAKFLVPWKRAADI